GLYTADTAELARTQRRVADAPLRTAELGAPGQDVPVIASESTGYHVGQEIDLRLPLAPVPATVTEVVEQYPGLPAGETLILADEERLADALARATSGTGQ